MWFPRHIRPQDAARQTFNSRDIQVLYRNDRCQSPVNTCIVVSCCCCWCCKATAIHSLCRRRRISAVIRQVSLAARLQRPPPDSIQIAVDRIRRCVRSVNLHTMMWKVSTLTSIKGYIAQWVSFDFTMFSSGCFYDDTVWMHGRNGDKVAHTWANWWELGKQVTRLLNETINLFKNNCCLIV